ncbi:MAG: SusC/RagA family TonB-linked outer membrane protein [Proteiniphilum sp.]|jgi:TonB-linked SusC/RagA family outer membrane protein|nr:SusC/RagA family TonB-linked outer membrane protein [Proteiniphilum sp.]
MCKKFTADRDTFNNFRYDLKIISSVLCLFFLSGMFSRASTGLTEREGQGTVPGSAEALVKEAVRQEKRTVRGRVTDSDGESVIGANIVEKGTSNGTVTDIDGNFTLQVEENAVLLISYIGYLAQEVGTAGRSSFDITLLEDTQSLEEVVVIAYGEQKRSAFTGSAVVVSSETISRRPVSNVMSVLEGISPGVQMESTSGSPTATPSFRIRGASSISAGRDPLIVVDGVPYESGWNNINPNDVESVTVLKDAASTAIYGARGGNGVVLVTTKKAVRDKKVSITLDTKLAISQVRRNDLYDVIDSPGEYYEQHYLAMYNYYRNVAGHNSFKANQEANKSWSRNSDEGGLGYLVYTVPDGELLVGQNGKLNPNATLGRLVMGTDNGEYFQTPDDWVSETYKTGLRRDYSLNINGGAENISLMASLGYTNDEGITDAAFFERYTGRLNGIFNARKWLRLTANLDVAVSEYANNTDYSDNSNNIFSNANRVAPIYPVYVRDRDGNILYDENGKVYDYGDGKHNGSISRPINPGSNRLQEALIQTRKYESMRTGAKTAADFIITPGLTATLNVAYDQVDRRYISTGQPFYGTSTPGGTTSISAGKNKTVNLQQLLNYTKRWNNHNIKVTLLHESFDSNSYYLSGSRSNMFNYFDNQELAGAITITGNNSYTRNYQSEGYGGRLLYDYKNTYNIDASFRRDASSRFHPDYRWGNFFSFGGAYLVSREDFFKVSWIDELKLKLSFGQNGNDQIGNHRYIDTYSIENLDGEIAVTFLNRGNKRITWETRTAVNTGMEFEIFKGRLTGGIDYYHNKTTNMLASVSVPYSLGYSSYYDNVGSMSNSGVELDLRGDIVRTKNFKWSMYLNASLNKSKVLELAEERTGETLYDLNGNSVSQGYSSGSYFYGEGLEFKTWYLKKFAGINEEGQPLWYVRDETSGEISTTATYSSASYFASGSSQPKVFGGFGGSFSWKALELTYAFSYRLGGYGYDSGYATLMTGPYTGRTGYNYHKDVRNSWTPENQNNDFARWQFDDRYFSSASDRWLTKADYLSLQNVSLGYNIPKNLIHRLGIEGLTVSAGVDNLFFLSHRKGFVPSRDFDGNVDFGYFPAMSRYMMNLNFKF